MASPARNTGVALATGAVVAFIDDDAVADTDWLKYLGAAYAHDGVLGVGGAIEPAWQHGRPAWFPAEFDWVVGCTYRGVPEFAGPVRNLIGANMSLRREVFDVVGGFNEGVGRVGAVPLGLRGDRALHPRRVAVARSHLPLRAPGARSAQGAGRPGPLVVLPGPLLRRRASRRPPSPASRGRRGASSRSAPTCVARCRAASCED